MPFCDNSSYLFTGNGSSISGSEDLYLFTGNGNNADYSQDDSFNFTGDGTTIDFCGHRSLGSYNGRYLLNVSPIYVITISPSVKYNIQVLEG